MQKFTRELTREIEVGGERLAVTLSDKGLSVRVVGTRRPPATMSWATWLCTCLGHPPAGPEPTAEEMAAAVHALRTAKTAPAAKDAPAAAEGEQSAPPEPMPSPSQTTSPPAGLSAHLARLDDWLARHRARFHAGLLPKASAAEVEALEKGLGTTVPQELRALLAWHNGQNPDVVGAFEQSWNLMSASQIADAKKELDGAAPSGWQRAWIPFLDDDAGNYVVLDTSGPDHPVREFWQGCGEHPVVAKSLAAWVEAFASAVQSGDYHEDPERGNFLRKR